MSLLSGDVEMRALLRGLVYWYGAERDMAARSQITKRLVTGMAFCWLVTGCSGGTTQKASKVATPTPTQTPAAPAAAAKQAILAGYSGMWSDYEKDELTANWEHPTVVNHATSKALLSLDENLAADHHFGWIGKGHAVLHPAVASMTPSVDPTSASVVDCADLANFLKYIAATGALKDSVPGGTHLVQAQMVLKDGAWKVSDITMGQSGSCGKRYQLPCSRWWLRASCRPPRARAGTPSTSRISRPLIPVP